MVASKEKPVSAEEKKDLEPHKPEATIENEKKTIEYQEPEGQVEETEDLRTMREPEAPVKNDKIVEKLKEHELKETAANLERQTIVVEEQPSVSVKRGRGRPRKKRLEESSFSSKEKKPEPPMVAKKNSREPNKQAIETSQRVAEEHQWEVFVKEKTASDIRSLIGNEINKAMKAIKNQASSCSARTRCECQEGASQGRDGHNGSGQYII